MTHAEVEWTLNRLGDVVDSVATDYTLAEERANDVVAIRRVDRDDSVVYDGSADIDMAEPLRKREKALKTGIFVGATFADRDFTPVGTEYNNRAETVIGLTVEGMNADKYGHVDPEGSNGAPIDIVVRRIRRALLSADARAYPDPGVPDVAYHDLIQVVDDPQSAQYRDFYRWQGEFAFRGYESLP
jgi:hypothetical protein